MHISDMVQCHRDADAACGVWLEQAKEAELNVACLNCKNPGCCSQILLGYIEEIDLLEGYLRKSRQDLIPKIRAFLEEYTALPADEQRDQKTQFLRGMNCPFLVGGRCSIYEARPVVCRTHFVLEDNESACNDRSVDARLVRQLDTSAIHRPIMKASRLREGVPLLLALGVRLFKGSLRRKCETLLESGDLVRWEGK